MFSDIHVTGMKHLRQIFRDGWTDGWDGTEVYGRINIKEGSDSRLPYLANVTYVLGQAMGQARAADLQRGETFGRSHLDIGLWETACEVGDP